MSQSRNCPQCGAAVGNHVRECWLCHAALSEPGAESAGEFGETPQPSDLPSAPPTNANVQFTLASLMLVMTLIAVCLGAATIAPGLGIGLAIAALPAVLRTTVLVRDFKAKHGQSPGMIDKTMTFMASLSLFLVIAVASAAGFYATCWVGFFGGVVVAQPFIGFDALGVGLTVGVILGIIAGLLILVVLWRKLFWPRRRGRFHRESDHNLLP